MVYRRTEKENAERIADAFQRNEFTIKHITECKFEVYARGTKNGDP